MTRFADLPSELQDKIMQLVLDAHTTAYYYENEIGGFDYDNDDPWPYWGPPGYCFCSDPYCGCHGPFNPDNPVHLGALTEYYEEVMQALGVFH